MPPEQWRPLLPEPCKSRSILDLNPQTTWKKKRPFSVELDECYEWDTLSHLLSFSRVSDTVALLDNPAENELVLGLGLEFIC